jgi:hypothetical protein
LTTSRTAAPGRTPSSSLCLPARDRAPSRVLQQKFFLPLILAGLAVCLVLYAVETAHFVRYGWHSPDNDAWNRDISACRPVPGSSTDIECPVRGYGYARYRFGPRQTPTHKEIFIIDRIQ